MVQVREVRQDQNQTVRGTLEEQKVSGTGTED